VKRTTTQETRGKTAGVANGLSPAVIYQERIKTVSLKAQFSRRDEKELGGQIQEDLASAPPRATLQEG